MKQRIVINQPCGIGDIFFCQKIKFKLEQENNEVIWPIQKEYQWASKYLKGNYPNKDDFKITSSDKIINLYNADIYFPNKKIMEAKYALIGIDYGDWINFFEFKRFPNKENELFFDILKIKENEKYALISKNYGTPPHFERFPIKEPQNIRKIYLDFYNEFSLFDWCKVIENASEIHMVDSSLNYIMEKIQFNIAYLYSRRPNNWSEIDYIFKKKYILMN